MSEHQIAAAAQLRDTSDDKIAVFYFEDGEVLIERIEEVLPGEVTQITVVTLMPERSWRLDWLLANIPMTGPESQAMRSFLEQHLPERTDA